MVNNTISFFFVYIPPSSPYQIMDELGLGDDPLGGSQHESMSDLASICSDCGVPVNIFNSMSEVGWTSEKFAVGNSSASELDDASVLSELGIDVALSRVERAALKVAWQRCITMAKSASDATVTTQANSSAVPGPTVESSDGSWSESFAPKLTSSTILKMKQRFQKSYPSEILCNDSMPSQRLLALVAHNVSKSNGNGFHGNLECPWPRRKTSKHPGVLRCRSWKVSTFMHC